MNKRYLDKYTNLFSNDMSDGLKTSLCVAKNKKSMLKGAILKQLEEKWLEFPELRFCQMLSNFISEHGDIYYMEDSVFLDSFSKYMDNLKSTPKYIVITVKSDSEKVTDRDCLIFRDELVGRGVLAEHSKIREFVEEINFSAVERAPLGNNSFSPPSVKTPEGYITPLELLSLSYNVGLYDNELCSFVVEMGSQSHTEGLYNYNHKDLCALFSCWLSEVYPNYDISVGIGEYPNSKETDKVLNDIYVDIIYDSKCKSFYNNGYTLDIPTGYKLKPFEKEGLEKRISNALGFKVRLEQFYCSVCAKNCISKPYHLEVECVGTLCNSVDLNGVKTRGVRDVESSI